MVLGFKDGSVKVLGYRLHFKTVGEPKKGTLLCLHGGPGDNLWEDIDMADLAPFGYKVVLYDRLGCGNSERPKSYSGYTVERLADEAEGVRKKLGLGRCHLWGYSAGAVLALQTILTYPRGFRSLVVSSGFASSQEAYQEWMRVVNRLPIKVRRDIVECEERGRLKERRYVRAVNQLLKEHVSDLRVQPYCVAIMRSLRNKKVGEVMFGDIEAITAPITGTMASWDVRKALPRIRVPTLVTAGAREPYLGIARRIHKSIGGSKLAVFKESGHDAIYKERDLYMKTVLSFLNSASRASPKR